MIKNKALVQSLHIYCQKKKLIPSGITLIIGLSGGPDSVFLIYFLHEFQSLYKIKLIAAHLDHQWRENSAQDVKFCQQVCENLRIPFVTKKIGELSVPFKNNGSQEELGRKYRRFFLESIRKEYNADFIALGHHADDQQETFFIRLARGSSLTGLTCMKEKEGIYLRPLLTVNKSDILEYLHAQRFLTCKIQLTLAIPIYAIVLENTLFLRSINAIPVLLLIFYQR